MNRHERDLIRWSLTGIAALLLLVWALAAVGQQARPYPTTLDRASHSSVLFNAPDSAITVYPDGESYEAILTMPDGREARLYFVYPENYLLGVCDTLTLAWDRPDTNRDGSPLLADEPLRYRVHLRGTAWTGFNTRGPQTWTFTWQGLDSLTAHVAAADTAANLGPSTTLEVRP